MSPSASLLPEPSSVTVTGGLTLWSAPASATGAVFAAGGTTTTVTVSVLLSVPSLTATLKVNMVFAVTVGAVNVGLAAVVLLSVTVVPEDCVHAYVKVSPSAS